MLSQIPDKPVCRRLDLRARRPAGGETEFLSATLTDDDDADRLDANDDCKVPDPDLLLGDTGLTVEAFLTHWRNGTPGLDTAARLYGRLLYRELLQQPGELSERWRQAVDLARARRAGLRLEIRCSLGSASHWRGQPLSALPFELMCDDQGYLFRRPGWSTVRRSRDLRSRELRWSRESAGCARVQVAWANVQRDDHPPMDDALFEVHDAAVETLAAAGHAQRLRPMPAATRAALADALEREQPHVLVWIGHGLGSGSGLLLHDADQPSYPADRGRVIAAGDFAAAVRAGRVDVALLWSCHGAGTFRSLDVGVAEALLDPERGDVAAVLASFSALDAAGVARLSKDLIDAWARGDGDLEQALARARGRLDELSLTWARPVLFLRTPLADPSPRLLRPRMPEPPTSAPAGRLRWLPPAPPHTMRYVDHQQRLRQLREDLAQHPVVVLEGLPGAGKTELALALVHELRSADHDVAFVDLSGQRSLGPLRQTLGLMVSATPFDDDARLLAALQDQCWTLVLDNAEDLLVDEALRRDLLQLLTGLRATGAGFRAVVTSRYALARAGTADADGLFSRDHALLNAAESYELFVAVAGPRLAPIQADRARLDPLLAELGGIARAIVLMAGQLGGEVDVEELQRRLAADGTEAIVEADLFGEPLPVSTSLDRHLHKSRLASALNLSLASAARQCTAVSVLFPVLGHFPAGLLQGLLPRTHKQELGDALISLLDHHLVQLVGEERRIVMAAPVRDWAVRRWSAQRSKGGAAMELLNAVHRALAGYVSGLDDDLGTERAQLARLRFLADAGNVVQALMLRMDAEWTAGDEMLVASLFRSAALFAVHGGTARASLAILVPLAARFLARHGDRAGATVAFHLGDLQVRTADLAGARQAYDLALPIYRQIEDRLGEANTLKALGDLQVRTDDLAGARQAYDLALPIYRQIEARLGEANTLQALGDLQVRTDDLAGARQAYDLALPIYRQIEARLGEANTLQALGRLHLAEGDATLAFAVTLRALEIQQQIGDRLGMAGTYGYLARIAAAVDAVDLAIVHGSRAFRLLAEVNDRFGQVLALTDLGQVLLRLEVEQGVAVLLLAQEIAGAIGDPHAEQLARFIRQFRAEGVDAAAFAAALAGLRDAAPQILDRLFAQADAAVASGRIDPMVLPAPQRSADDEA